MDLFEYISVLTSIIIGLGIAHLLRGIARMVQHPGRHRTWWVHLVWVANMFFYMVFWWWWEFNLGKLEIWHFEDYLFVLVYAVVLYLCCALLFPEDLSDYDGWEDYLMSRRVWFFGLLALTNVIDVYDTWLKGAEHFERAGTAYFILTATTFIGYIVATITSNRRYHKVFVFALFAYQVYWAFSFIGTLG